MTNYGRTFTTFEKERNEESKRKQINDDKDFYGLLQNKFIYKWRYFPYFVSGVTFAFSIYSYFNPRNATPNLQPIQTEIEVLTKRVNGIDSMFRSDSLSRKSKK